MPVHNTRCPVVVRCEELWPHQLVGYEKHRLRTHKKNKDHRDPNRRHLNTRPLGKTNWLALVQARIELMRQENFAEKLAAQKRQSRIKDMRETIRKGPQDPWERSENGPIREIILTAHHQWFEGANTPEEAKLMAARQAAEAVARDKTGASRATNPRRTQALNAREAAFEAVAVYWLQATFKDAVLQARSDRDELGYHIHAIVMVTRDWESDRQGKQTRIQPSKHPLFKDYEKLQEDARKAFAAVGLTRGKRTKRAREEIRSAARNSRRRRSTCTRASTRRRRTSAWLRNATGGTPTPQRLSDGPGRSRRARPRPTRGTTRRTPSSPPPRALRAARSTSRRRPRGSPSASSHGRVAAAYPESAQGGHARAVVLPPSLRANAGRGRSGHRKGLGGTLRCAQNGP